MAEATRRRIIDAAIETVKARGFAGASSRAIAATGDVNPALIFYYFDGLHDLLAAALEASSAERLDRHRGRAEAATTLPELLSVLEDIYREDRESGYIRFVSELVAGGVANPDLGTRVVALMEPWIDIAEDAAERVFAGSGLDGLISPRQLAFAAVTFYLGANVLTHLVPERGDIEELLESGRDVAALVELLRGGGRAVARGGSG